MEKIAKKRPPGMLIYEEFVKILVDAPDDQAGRIFKALGRYFLTDEVEPLDDPLEQSLFNVIFEKLIENEANYNKMCESQSKKADKRWHPEKYE